MKPNKRIAAVGKINRYGGIVITPDKVYTNAELEERYGREIGEIRMDAEDMRRSEIEENGGDIDER